MLAGKKHFAVFSDVVRDGQAISEDIIPENAFAPYVVSGKFSRFEKIFYAAKINDQILYVCFTTPSETWRANCFFWIKQQSLSGQRPQDDADEILIGRLLDYTESDIKDFVRQFKPIC